MDGMQGEGGTRSFLRMFEFLFNGPGSTDMELTSGSDVLEMIHSELFKVAPGGMGGNVLQTSKSPLYLEEKQIK